MNTTISKEERFTTYKTLAPGPGAYEFKNVFPGGPTHHIQRKSKFDSLIGTKVHQSVSQGPAKYRISRKIGGTHQSIGIKFKGKKPEVAMYKTGPSSYDINPVKFLKRSPSATVGRSRRLFIHTKTIAPGPNKYSSHHRMTDSRCNS